MLAPGALAAAEEEAEAAREAEAAGGKKKKKGPNNAILPPSEQAVGNQVERRDIDDLFMSLSMILAHFFAPDPGSVPQPYADVPARAGLHAGKGQQGRWIITYSFGKT